MADVSDVSNALVALINTAVYPTGSPPSVLGLHVKIYAGWPDPDTLNADLKSDAITPPAALHVSVYPRDEERNTTRFPTDWAQASLSPTTYTLSQLGQTVTVGGAAPSPYVPQNLFVFVNGRPYGVQATAGQTAAQIAGVLQALIVADVAGTTVAGAVITLPAGVRIGALRVGSTGVAIKLVRQQEKLFQISCWADTPANRAALAQAFDPLLADTSRLTMADGTGGLLTYKSCAENDTDQKLGIYRRDLLYTVEYSTIRTEVETQIGVLTENVTDGYGDPIATVMS
jgi:hypothetical protein